MAVTVGGSDSGSQTATLDTDHTLITKSAPSSGGTFQLVVDAANLANGEELVLTLETKARAADTRRRVWRDRVADVLDTPILASPYVSIESGNELVCVLRQEGGSGRVFPWALKRVDG
jgi:hypothetical protein